MESGVCPLLFGMSGSARFSKRSRTMLALQPCLTALHNGGETSCSQNGIAATSGSACRISLTFSNESMQRAPNKGGKGFSRGAPGGLSDRVISAFRGVAGGVSYVHASSPPNVAISAEDSCAPLLLLGPLADSNASARPPAASETGGGAPSTCMSCAASSSTLVPAKRDEQLKPPYRLLTPWAGIIHGADMSPTPGATHVFRGL